MTMYCHPDDFFFFSPYILPFKYICIYIKYFVKLIVIHDDIILYNILLNLSNA